MPPWNSWDTNTLPLCKHWRNAHEVVYPYVGANCVTSRHEELPKDALAQEEPEEKEGDKMPPWNSWDRETLPLCKHWRNAHEVPYPMVGANCVDKRNLIKHEPLTKDALV